MPPVYGVNVHIPWAGHTALIRPAGFQIARIDLNMEWVCPEPGVWRWEEYDRTFAELRHANVSIYPTLAHLPPWMAVHTNAPPASPQAVSQWLGWVQAVVTRYQAYTDVWSIWNEPNLHGTSPHTYVWDILQPAAQAIRMVQRDALVVGPELATHGRWESWLRECLQQGQPFLDAVSVHAYGGNGREVARRLYEGSGSVRAQMTRVGCGHLPLALTEYGWNSARVGMDAQASGHDQFVEVMAGRDDPCVCLAYQLVDHDPDEQWGLVTGALAPKPAYRIYQQRLLGVASPSPKERFL